MKKMINAGVASALSRLSDSDSEPEKEEKKNPAQ